MIFGQQSLKILRDYIETATKDTNQLHEEISSIENHFARVRDESSEMNRIHVLLNNDDFVSKEFTKIYHSLYEQLGKTDPFIVALDFEITLVKKRKEKRDKIKMEKNL